MPKARQYLPTLLLTLGVLATTSACAQRVYGTHESYSQEFERRAYANGFQSGREHGYDDVRHRREYSYSRHPAYRDADDGYRRGDGDRNTYRRTFRQGFENGYSDGFNGRDHDRDRR